MLCSHLQLGGQVLRRGPEDARSHGVQIGAVQGGPHGLAPHAPGVAAGDGKAVAKEELRHLLSSTMHLKTHPSEHAVPTP